MRDSANLEIQITKCDLNKPADLDWSTRDLGSEAKERDGSHGECH